MQLRERYQYGDPQTFATAELLALILGTGTPGRSALSVASDLLNHFETLHNLVSAETRQLQQIDGIGPVRALRLHAALQLGRRAAQQPSPPVGMVEAIDDAVALLGPPLQGRQTEALHALYLDRRHRPLTHRQLTEGSDGCTVVDPRQIFRPAVQLGASAVILAHNHPSGDPSPSQQDRMVTRRVEQAGRVLGITLLDHLIFAGDQWTSLAARGWVQAAPQAPGWIHDEDAP